MLPDQALRLNKLACQTRRANSAVESLLVLVLLGLLQPLDERLRVAQKHVLALSQQTNCGARSAYKSVHLHH